MRKDLEKKQPSLIVSESGTEEQLIRARAFELYVDRGMEDGHDLEDWLHAEEEVMSVKERSVAA